MAKVNIDIIGKDKASGSIKGVTSSFIKAQLAVEGMKIASKALLDITKKSITAFAEQEKQEKQLEAVIKSTGMAAGLTAEEIKNMASSLQEVTTFGDEAILRGQNMLLTFTKIGEEVFPAATETMLNMSEAMGTDLKAQAIQLGKALNDPIQGISALSRVGVQLSEQQEKSIQDFMDINDIASAQKVILGELETQFGGAAKAARDTFGGSLKALKNVQGDNLEAIGKIVSVVGKDFVDAMTDAAKALNEFLTDTDVIANVAATFKIIGTVVKELGSKIFKTLGDALKDIVKSFKNLVGDGQGTFDAFMMISGAVKTLGVGITIGVKLVRNIIVAFIDLIKIAKETGKVLALVAQALINPTQWKKVKDQLGSVKDSFVNMGKNIVDNTADTINTVVKEFSTFPTQVKSSAKQYRSIFEKENKRVKNSFKETKDSIVQDNKEIGESTTGVETLVEKNKRLLAENDKMWQDQQKNRKMNMEEMTATITQHGSQWTGIVSGFTSQISGIFQEFNSRNLEAQERWQEDHLSSVDSWMESELERQGVREETKLESAQREFDEADALMSAAATRDEQARAKELVEEKRKELARAKIVDEGEKKKAKIREAAEAKIRAEKKKQFDMNKGFSIANVWLDAASAVMGWWAAFAGMGIPGIVLAGVMTAATLAMAGVQCHGKGQLIKMYDGTNKKVEDIKVDDLIMGDNDTPRRVLELYSGYSHMYKMNYNDYEWTATGNHILCLTDGKGFYEYPISEYLKTDRSLKLYRKINNVVKIVKNVIFEYIGFTKFYGFNIDGNNLYKLPDNTVTHNTGMIASQTFHGQEGGVVPAGQTTGDNTMLFANKGEALLRNDDYNNLVDMARGEGKASNIVIEFMEVKADNPEQFKDQMITVSHFEGNR